MSDGDRDNLEQFILAFNTDFAPIVGQHSTPSDDPGNLEAMASILDYCKDQPEKTFAAGDVLLHEGRRAGILYVLIEGEVEILKRDVQINIVSDRGAIFGEISVLLNVPHMATVRTTKPSRFHVIDKARRFLEVHPDLAFHIAKLLGQRLRLVTTYLVDLKKQFEQHEDHLGMVDEVLESLVHHQGED